MRNTNIFISPHKTKEERVERIKLVKLKNPKIKSDLEKYHYISETAVAYCISRDSRDYWACKLVNYVYPARAHPQVNPYFAIEIFNLGKQYKITVQNQIFNRKLTTVALVKIYTKILNMLKLINYLFVYLLTLIKYSAINLELEI